MQFEHFITPDPVTPLAVIIGGLAVLLMAVGIFITLKKNNVLWFFGSAGIAFLALLFTFFGMVDANKDAYSRNMEIASQNLMKKYEVSNVYWNSGESNTSINSTEAKYNVLVETDNSQQYIFRYRIDPQTNEPFLINMPVRGGDTPTAPVNADSLLRNK